MRTKGSVFLAIVAGVAFAQAAAAADLGSAPRRPVHDESVPYGPAFSWTGLYIGTHVGYGWSDADWGDAVSGVSTSNLHPGYQKLDGGEALSYVRYRHTDSDIYRAARQQDFLRQAANQKSVRQLHSIGDAKHLLARLEEYFRFDKKFLSRRNLAGSLITLAEGLRQRGLPELARRAATFADGMSFSFLYDPPRGVLSIGYLLRH